MDFDLGRRQTTEWSSLSFNQQYQMLIKPHAAVRAGPLKIENPLLKGDEINFSLAIGAIRYKFTGKIQGDRMEGHCRHSGQPAKRSRGAPQAAAG